MRYLLLVSIFIADVIAENENTTVEFMPIGKDITVAPVNAETRKPEIISSRVFKEDGIKYTEIIRKTSPGATQTVHIKVDENPSILPVPVPNLSGLMKRLQTTLAKKLEVSSREYDPPIRTTTPEYFPPVTATIVRAEGPINQRPIGFDPLPNYQYPPPPYPPMMYPPPSYSLMGRVGSMTDNILDNVMEFVLGRRRR